MKKKLLPVLAALAAVSSAAFASPAAPMEAGERIGVPCQIRGEAAGIREKAASRCVSQVACPSSAGNVGEKLHSRLRLQREPISPRRKAPWKAPRKDPGRKPWQDPWDAKPLPETKTPSAASTHYTFRGEA